MKPKQQTDIMYILIPSFVLVLAWIIFTVYNSAVSSTITATQSSSIKPISPTFELGVLENLKKRKKILPIMTQEIDISSVEQLPVSSGSSQLQALPVLLPPTSPQIQSAAEAPVASGGGVEDVSP